MEITITGVDLPGNQFCSPDGSPYGNVHVALQVRKESVSLVRGDAAFAQWDISVEVVQRPDGVRDFRGPAVHGKRGDRFLYLTWGNLEDDGSFPTFRRAKLMLDRVDADLMALAVRNDDLRCEVVLTSDDGSPRCARVDPPAITWSTQATV